MDEKVLAIVVFSAALILLVSGIPIWAGLTGISLFFVVLLSPHLLETVPYVFHGSMDSFALLAIPLFILLSAPISASKASRDLYEAMHRWMYKLPGGLGISTMLACGVFAALCGSSPATAAAIGGIGIPEMRKRGYPASLACGLVAHAGTFGILIPPSITMILYGVATETSIGKCFIAGIIPGLLEIFLSCIWVVIYFKWVRKKPVNLGPLGAIIPGGAAVVAVEEEHFTLQEKLESLPKVLPFILIIGGIMGSLYGGWATPSEAAGLGAFGSILLVLIVYRSSLNRKVIQKIWC